jgi:hypothetical protein
LVFFSSVTGEFIYLQIQGLYPKARIDVEVSSDEDVEPKPDAPIDQKKASDGDDSGDGGVSSAKSITPNPISPSAPEQSDPSTIVRVPGDVPHTSGHGRKHPPPATMQNKPILEVDQVMTPQSLGFSCYRDCLWTHI